MPGERRAPWRNRRALIGAGVVLALALAAGLLLARGSGAEDERRALIEEWDNQLSTWQTSTLERIGPGGVEQPGAAGHELAALFEPALTEPVRYPDEQVGTETDALDATNASCTSLTSGIQDVEEAVQPPAPPQELDVEHPDAEDVASRFDASRTALAAYQEGVTQHAPAMRGFCGSYPALVAAHLEAGSARAELEDLVACTEQDCTVAAGADPDLVRELAENATIVANQRIAASLSAQCYLADLAPVCSADAAEASALAAAWAGWPDDLTSDPGASGDTLTQIRQVQADAETDISSAIADLGDGRQDVSDLARGQLEETATQLDQAAADFETALG